MEGVTVEGVLILFFALAGIFWTILTAAVWLRRRKPPMVPGGLAATCAVIVVILLAGVGQMFSGQAPGANDEARAWARTASERARVDRLHREFAPALERYRQANGQYPSTLAAVGVTTPDTPYGPLHYYGSGPVPPQWYLISFGDPSEDGFSADWDSRTQAWTVAAFGF
jgi:hypothetical protein